MGTRSNITNWTLSCFEHFIVKRAPVDMLAPNNSRGMPYQIDEKHLTIFPEYFVGVVKLAIICYSNCFLLQADSGFASGAVFFGGGRGRFVKKGVTLRGLRISEKKEILRKLTVCTYIRTYLSTLSTKDFAKINKITMVMPFAGSYCMTMIFLPPPPL